MPHASIKDLLSRLNSKVPPPSLLEFEERFRQGVAREARDGLPTDYSYLMAQYGHCNFGRCWDFGLPFTCDDWHLAVTGQMTREVEGYALWLERLSVLNLLAFSSSLSGRHHLTWHRAVSTHPDDWPVVLIDLNYTWAMTVGRSMADALIRWAKGDWRISKDIVSEDHAYSLEYGIAHGAS